METFSVRSGNSLAERRFFAGMASLILLVVFVGFSPSFFLRPLFPEWPAPPETLFYVHGAVFAAWIMLFATQASLISAGHTRLHRRIGPFGAALAVVMVVLGTQAALVAANRPSGFVGIPVPPLQFLAVPIFDMVLFPVLVSLAIAQRNKAQHHKRWMLLATISLITAALARWPGVSPLGPLAYFGLTDLFIVALVIWDFRVFGRVHPATLWGGLLIIASQPLRLAIWGTEPWLAFARWATGLVG